ncbi:MAG: peptidylprolyl isomerase [Chitinispirillales bacterium]|jgi:peptidyl-prolyl cis-trans isomerase SurA|nr:peptidylprolyl isomerase [Chitinispirillales bacterium]
MKYKKAQIIATMALLIMAAAFSWADDEGQADSLSIQTERSAELSEDIAASADIDDSEAADAAREAAAIHPADAMRKFGIVYDEPLAEQLDTVPATPVRFSQEGRLDGIAAVVGSEIVLFSELEAYAYMRFSAMGLNPDQVDVREFLYESLEDLIDNKILVVRAMEDTTIHVRNSEIESMLNNHISAILRQNNITMQQFDELLRIQQGTTLTRFRTEARRAIREQLYRQKLQQNYYFSVRVNRRDVEQFFAQYADSLPSAGESFELLKLTLRLASTDSVRQAAFDKIHSIKHRLDAGESFEELARTYSEGPEAASGGDLGHLVKGSTTEIAFEERAFALPVGRISEPFETRLGFHIIVVEEKRDMRVRLRQILIRHMPTERQREEVIATLDSLRQSVGSREEFEAAARAMSVDPATRLRGGDMGWLTPAEMPPAMRNIVTHLESGRISTPVVEDNLFSIYMVNQRVDSRRLTLENDYTLIEAKARDITAQKLLIENVRRWRERIFIDVRI